MSTPKKDAHQRAAEAAITAAVAQARQRRAEASAEYEDQTKGLLFTKAFNTALEANMGDELATTGQRFLAWLERYSWGEYSLYAIDVDGMPKFQVDCARELGIDKSRLSHVVAYYEARGYVRTEGKRLFLVIAPKLGPVPDEKRPSREFKEFVENWKVAHSSDFQELEVARSTVKRIRKVILSDYKKSKERSTKGADTLLETARQLPDSQAGSRLLTPLEESQQRHKQPTPAKTLPVESGAQFSARSYLFAQIRRMQITYSESAFAHPAIDPEAPEHQQLISLIVKKLGHQDEEYVVGYVMWIAAQFKGLGQTGKRRQPGDKHGPNSLGLLVGWAEDYARVAGGQAKGAG